MNLHEKEVISPYLEGLFLLHGTRVSPYDDLNTKLNQVNTLSISIKPPKLLFFENLKFL